MTLRLYDYLSSGNGYKVRLLLAQLDIPFERIERDIDAGETRTPEFLAINPDGRIPVLEFEDGRRLAQSDAILFHLAEGTRFLPDDSWGRAQVLQWLFFEQYSHEPSVAVARFWMQHLPPGSKSEAEFAQKHAKGYAALDVIERGLAEDGFLVGGSYSIADIALYAYTHVADEGGFELGRYPAIGRWLERVRAEPRHIPITRG